MKAYAFGLFTITILVLVTGTATAQSVVKDAHFTLPFEAKWGDTVLPAGDYTLSVARISSGRDVDFRIVFAGQGKRTAILAVRRPGPKAGERSMLVAMRSEGKYTISALHLSKADLVFTFPAPKKEPTLRAGAAEMTETVPILIAEK